MGWGENVLVSNSNDDGDEIMIVAVCFELGNHCTLPDLICRKLRVVSIIIPESEA